MTVTRDQFYLFTMPGDMCPVWAEDFGKDGRHTVAPTPYFTVDAAAKALKALHPDATVDELDDPRDIEQVRGWARTCPLEQIPA